MKRSLLSILLSVSAAAQAQQVSFSAAQEFDFKSPQGVSESCVIPRKLMGDLADQVDFSDKDLESELNLCKIDFYGSVGICPKLNSTNPGTLVSKLPAGMDKQSFEAKHCKDDDPQQKIQAKFKQSISCSYTGSGLAAYQLSRVLGGIGRVPVAVYRTMDKVEHKEVTDKALAMLGSSKDLIAQTWRDLNNAHNTMTPRVFTRDGQLYGFLSENPKGEDKYTEVSGVGAYETRYQRFVKQDPFLRVASTASVESLAGGSDLQRVLPIVVQMKDVSDMVLLDTLLSQDDRIGNIHFKFRWYYMENGKLVEKKSEARRAVRGEDGKINYRGVFQAIVPTEELAAMKAVNGVLVKEMLLKDNDCGVDMSPTKNGSPRRGNMMRIVSAIEQLRHMSGETYTNFMRFAATVKSNKDQIKQYFMTDLKFQDIDFEGKRMSFMANLEKAQSVLYANCKAGLLKLDLDKKQYLPGQEKKVYSCDI